MTQSVDANKTVARRLAEQVFSSGDTRAFDELFAEDYVMHNMPVQGVPGTKAGFRQVVQATRQAFPDIRVHIEHVVSEGDMVVFHDTVQATSLGDFLGVPATGQRIGWTEIHFLRVRDGQIIEHWTNFDQLGILRQLGAVPA
jgi:steroid delta-isomerase-like uncharacterized protein